MEPVANMDSVVDTDALLTHINVAIANAEAVKREPQMRKSLLDACRRLTATLELPVETILRFGWQVMSRIMSGLSLGTY